MSDDIPKQDAPQTGAEGQTTGVPAELATTDPSPAPPAEDGPAAGPLTPADLQRVDELSRQVDVTDTQAVLAFGLPAQSRIANFADSLLGDVRTRDAGSGGEALQDLLKGARDRRGCAQRRVRQSAASDHRASWPTPSSGSRPAIRRWPRAWRRSSTRWSARAWRCSRTSPCWTGSELNMDYLKQLDVYIAAGEQALHILRSEKIPALEDRRWRPAAMSCPPSASPTSSRPPPGSSAVCTTSSSRA